MLSSRGKSYTLLLAWVMNFFSQTMLQSAKHSLSTEDTIDFTHDRYAYRHIYIHKKHIYIHKKHTYIHEKLIQ